MSPTPINLQTPGPLLVLDGWNRHSRPRDSSPTDWRQIVGGDSAKPGAHVDGADLVASCESNTHPRETALRNRSNAALVAAAYTSFDKAGRELGIDAAKLAERLDLTALIRAAVSVMQNADDTGCSDDLTVTSRAGIEALCDLLPTSVWPRK